jgi:O-antigen/teichoic acid export membrane protein
MSRGVATSEGSQAFAHHEALNRKVETKQDVLHDTGLLGSFACSAVAKESEMSLHTGVDGDHVTAFQFKGPRTPISHLKAKIGANHQVLHSLAAVFGSNITSSLLGVLGGLLVARFLGPEETGLYRTFTIPLMYLVFLHLGTFDGLWRQIPYYVGKKMPEKVEALASCAGAWNILVSIIVSIGFSICALRSLWRQDLYGVVGWLSQVLCCWGIFYGGYLGATYRTINQFVALARVQLIQATLNFAMVFLVPFLRFYGLCIRSGFPPVAGLCLYHRNRPVKVPYHFDTKSLSEIVKIGLPFSFWGSLYTSAWTATESVLMLSLGGVTGLGLFAIAAVLRDGINILPGAFNQVIMPRVVEAFASEESVRRANARTVWLTVGLSAFMVLIVVIVSYLVEFFVPLAIPKYVDGIPLMKICLWFAVTQAASLPFNTLFAVGRAWIFGRGIIIGLVVFPLTAYMLAPTLGGVLAVAVGSLSGRVARTIAAYLEIYVLIRREV